MAKKNLKSKKKVKLSVKKVSKPAKKKVTKKAVAKVAPVKSKRTTKAVIKTAATTVPQATSPTVTAPNRAPVRKIFGANNSVTVVPTKPASNPQVVSTTGTEILESEIAQVTPTNTAISIKTERPVAPKELVPTPKVSWEELPSSLPAHIRFLVGSITKECSQAAGSPFPLAKFIHALPKEMCGVEFSFLLMSLQMSDNEIAQSSGFDQSKVEAMVSVAGGNLSEMFASYCPEMYRKWRTQLSGRSVPVEQLIEQYLVANVDPALQAMLGAILLKAMGVKNPIFVNAA